MSERCECGREEPSAYHNFMCDDAPSSLDGTCDMCGENYDSYLDHLKACDGGRASD